MVKYFLKIIGQTFFWVIMFIPLMFIQTLDGTDDDILFLVTIIVSIPCIVACCLIFASKKQNNPEYSKERFLGKVVFNILFLIFIIFNILGWIKVLIIVSENYMNPAKVYVYFIYLLSNLSFSICLYYGIITGRLDSTLNNKNK